LGEFIDSCDRVVRINDFEIAGYERCVGRKLDVVCYAFSPINKIRRSDVERASEVWCCRPFNASRRAVAEKKASGQNVLPISSEVWKLAVHVVRTHPRQQPSSGLATVYMAIDRWPEADIFIIGFDSDKYKKHYFDPDFIDDDGEPGHDWQLEMEHIQLLAKEGNVTML
jgi:hypothetical protein